MGSYFFKPVDRRAQVDTVALVNFVGCVEEVHFDELFYVSEFPSVRHLIAPFIEARKFVLCSGAVPEEFQEHTVLKRTKDGIFLIRGTTE